ncbi:MAG: transporter substrate-binding domain-containing protein [Deltaproteobacteria bacterium]|nr:transporter substrate-binding domain-containing protein [Deltaproteobacteria bacterium]
MRGSWAEKSRKSLALIAFFALLILLGCSGDQNGRRILSAPSDLNSPDFTIGVPQGTAAMTAVENNFPLAKIEYHQSLPDGYLSVKYGKIDAFAFDRHAMQYVAVHNADLALMDEKVGDEFIVVGTAFGREALIKKVNEFIKKYKADGTYRDMYDRWLLGKNLTMPDLPEPSHPTMTLRIGTDGRNEPMSFYVNRQLTGFDIEFAKRLAFFLNAKFTFSIIEFPAIIAAATSGKIDLLIANLNATPERSKVMLFSDTYVDSEVSFLVRKDRLAPKTTKAITDIAELAGKKVGVQTGTTYEDVLKRSIPDAIPMYFTTFTDQIEAVKSGKIAGFLADEVLAMGVVRETPGVTYLKKWLASNEYAFAFSKSQPALHKQVNAILEQLKSDGTFQKLEDKWFGGNDAAKVLPDFNRDGKNGIIRFATNSDSAPFVYVKNGKLVGYDIEVALMVAARLGKKLEIMDMDFSAIIPSLVSGKSDMAGDFITITPERAKSVLFSIPYYKGGTIVVVAADLAAGAQSPIAALSDLAGKKVGIVTGSAYDSVLKSKNPLAVPEYFNNFPDQAEALKAGKIAAFLIDEPMARDIMNRTGGVTLLKELLTSDGYAFALAKSRSRLQKEMNAVLKEMTEDGALKKIDARWFGTDEKAKVLPDIRLEGKKGTIRLATNSGMAPFAYLKDGKIVGYDIEIARIICARLGYQLEIIDMDIAAIIPSLISGKSDLAACGITVTDERAKSVLFTRPNYQGGIAVMIRLSSPARAVINIQNVAELSGRKVGVLTGSTYDGVLGRHNPRALPEYFNNFSDQTEALKTGKIAGFLVDEPIARDIVNHSTGVTTLKKLLTADGYAFAFAKNQTNLHRQVDAALTEMKNDGTIKKLEEKWFGTNDAAKVLPDLKLENKNGIIRLATNGNLAPFAYVKDGRMVGYDIEIAMMIAQRLGRGLEIMDMDFAAIIPSLVSGKSDMGAGGIIVTGERAKSVLFSIPDYQGGVAVMVAKADAGPGAGDGSAIWPGLVQSFQRTFVVEDRYKLVLQGLWVTVMISVLSGIFGTLLGFGVCVLRRSKTRWANMPAKAFIRAIQGTPIVVLLMILYYVIFGSWDINAILVAVIGFSINFAAYVSEMMRTGIDAVDKGQHEAAYAIGFNRVQVFTKITFPQAARHVLPVFKGEFISMLKMTSVVGYIAIQDLTKMSDIIRSRTYEAFFPLIATALIYFVIAYALAYLLSLIEMRVDPKQRKRVVKGV